MYTVLVYGAGSIGNHLAYACRLKGWETVICDVDPEALRRTREDIYPGRYGNWDPEIQLTTADKLPDSNTDLVIIGTPPDTHISLALSVLERNPPKVLLIEKPLCTPSLEGARELFELAGSTGTFVCVGYNHTMTDNTRRAEEILAKNIIGTPISISAKFREHWWGIFSAHPWLAGPQDTYLGFAARGGGASGEHSHAMNIWQHFAHLAGMGRIVEVSAMMDMVDDGVVKYDRVCLLNVSTEKGLVGNIAQDVITEPAQKILRVHGSEGFLEWYVNIDGGHDALRYSDGNGETKEELIPKNRPDDFKGEIDAIEKILAGSDKPDNPISLERGLDTMMVVAAAHVSHKKRKTVRINYQAGYGLDAIEALL